jgi:hypothetical protein
MRINKKQNSKTKIVAIIAAACIAVGIVYLGIAFANKYPPFTKDSAIKIGDQTINLERSDAEKQKSQELSDNPDLKTENNQTDTPAAPTEKTDNGKQAVNVLLTSAGITNNTVRASGMVTNIVEEGGECTYTFTNGSSTVSKKSNTLTNPTSTTCEAVTFSPDELSSGTWKVVLNYNSTNATGTSNTKEFTK